ncbi:zinc finger protein draculin [Drosophila rhopaloa]|uniref:Zinc finger protein draculin n=1 Tax=Drosophila rhopaloa TaxID=1041015 RepID=A0A6P4E0K1_DRORH|nr:zinc finger protein draculin [Drosophila rhopaloa]
MTSGENWISVELEPATLLSEKEEDGIVTRVFIAPCSEPRIKKPLAERKPAVFPEDNTLLYHCPFCANGIRTGGAFKVHMLACQRRFKNMQKDGIVMMCSICKKHFNSVESLGRHRLLHGNMKITRRCGSCNLKFETEVEYRAHLKTHLRSRNSKPVSEDGELTVTKCFNCLFCRKDFLASFRPGQMARRYACDDCVQKIKVKEAESKQTENMKRKADFSCDRCGRMYKLEGFLNRHLKLCQGRISKRNRKYEIHDVS